MTKQIRKSAPAGATHFAIIMGEPTYFMINGESVERYCEMGWVGCSRKPTTLYALYAPWWVEPVIMLVVMAVSAGVLLWKL